MRVGFGTSMPLPKVAENVGTERPFEEGNSTFSGSSSKRHFSGKTGRKSSPSRGSSALRYRGRPFPKLKRQIKPKINVMTISAPETTAITAKNGQSTKVHRKEVLQIKEINRSSIRTLTTHDLNNAAQRLMKSRLKTKKSSANMRASRRTENQPYQRVICSGTLDTIFSENYLPGTTMV